MEGCVHAVNNGYDMTFQYKKPRVEKPPVERLVEPQDNRKTTEQLTGIINGIRANSKGEERFARALAKDPNIAGFIYSYIVGTQGMPGWKQLDFLVQTKSGDFHAFSIKDYEFVHHGVASDTQDMINEVTIIEQLEKTGFPVRVVESIDSRDLDTQEQADALVKEIL
jgi:hypothetical protein